LLNIDNEKIKIEKKTLNKSIGTIFNEYNSKFLSLANNIVFCKETAEDIVQESYADLIEKINSYNGDSKLYTYLYRIIINNSIDYLRKEKNHKKAICYLKNDVYNDISEKELKIIVNEALLKLTLKYRIPIILLEFENKSYEEISEILKISLDNVKVVIFRAREKLIKIFKRMGVDNYVL